MSNDKLSEAEEEISLVDLLYSLLEHWRMLIVLPTIVALGGLVAVNVRPDQWEARGIIEIGMMGTIGATGSIGAAKIETVSMLLERINLPQTRIRAEQVLALEQQNGNDKNSSIKKIYANRVSDTDLVELRVRAPSKQEAENQAMAIIQAVQEGHHKEANHVQQLIVSRLKERKLELEALNIQLRAYPGRSKTSQSNPERRFGEDMLYAAYVGGLETRKHQLAAEIAELEMSSALSEARQTRLFGNASHVTSALVEPRRGLFVALAWLIGFGVALLSVFIHQMLRNADKNAETAGKLTKIRNLQWLKRG